MQGCGEPDRWDTGIDAPADPDKFLSLDSCDHSPCDVQGSGEPDRWDTGIDAPAGAQQPVAAALSGLVRPAGRSSEGRDAAQYPLAALLPPLPAGLLPLTLWQPACRSVPTQVSLAIPCLMGFLPLTLWQPACRSVPTRVSLAIPCLMGFLPLTLWQPACRSVPAQVAFAKLCSTLHFSWHVLLQVCITPLFSVHFALLSLPYTLYIPDCEKLSVTLSATWHLIASLNYPGTSHRLAVMLLKNGFSISKAPLT